MHDPGFVPTGANPKNSFLIKLNRAIVFGSIRFLSRIAGPAHDLRRQLSDSGDELLPCGPHWRGEKASGFGRWETSSFPAAAKRRTPCRPSRPTAKFSAVQSLENPQNAERISILRAPVPQAGGPRTEEEARRATGSAARAIRATALEGSKRPGRKLQKKGKSRLTS